MTDIGKVIKGFECCKDIHTAGPGYAQGCILCPYGETPSDGAGGYACFRAMVKDAIVLLKAQGQATEQLHGGYIENLITTAIALKLKNVSLPTDAALEIVRRLKAQEPRVMRLDEIGNALKMPLWKETKSGHKDLYNGWVLAYDIQTGLGITGTRRLGMSEPSGRVVWYRLDNYGRIWRLWTAKPNAEQQEEVKWE